ncbi:winged helix-turn-helix transcriptional regulator [Aureimonas glaciei]|jgi:DNA-binding HxlR family transcriptional regulator|uniref:HxlR family transcriptional regulator n=1 Tax=Aureimonas glaciei TaxID=1776957 RepID=A0A917D975_9HYPH|nr:helix-turn-helix domain-containing protein [Aureimonas glaciei]GGD12678.1 HxlR family transcriptional regulator [Aureimonas glaciei]
MDDMCDPTFAEACATRPILDEIANKWSIMILSVLCNQPTRFNMLRRRLEGVTQKALTQALRRLERNGLVSRRVITSSPVAVEYSITPLGHSLKEPMAALYLWTLDHVSDLEAAQREFDQRPDS